MRYCSLSDVMIRFVSMLREAAKRVPRLGDIFFKKKRKLGKNQTTWKFGFTGLENRRLVDGRTPGSLSTAAGGSMESFHEMSLPNIHWPVQKIQNLNTVDHQNAEQRRVKPKHFKNTSCHTFSNLSSSSSPTRKEWASSSMN